MTPAGYLIASWLLSTVVGWGTAAALLPRNWSRDRALLAPVFGAAILVLLSAFFSYAGFTMRSAAPYVLGAGVGLSAVGAFTSLRRPTKTTDRWRTYGFHAAGLLSAIGLLWGVLSYHAWNPYNDAFTYMVIADYLQTHSFFTPAIATTTEPLLTQMAAYQSLGFRMGSNFLLAFLTALFRAPYSFDLYMPTLALGLWLAVPGFWVFCRRGLLMAAPAAGLATVIYALHTSIPLTNALWGFMPQTWGIAFLMALVPLHIRAASRADRLRRLLCAGLFGGTLLLTYTEIVPFVLCSVGTCYLARLLRGRLTLTSALVGGGGPLIVAVALAPIAAWTFVPNLRNQVNAVVGWDPQLSLFDYAGLVAGYRTIADTVLHAPSAAGAVYRIASLAAVITMIVGVFHATRRAAQQIVCVGGVFILALGWFALAARNPWTPSQFGQPWSTYKVVTYGFYLFIACWSIGLVVLWRRRLLRPLVVAQIAALIVVFPVTSVAMARIQARQIGLYTGNRQDPIAEYKRLPTLFADVPRDRPVVLKIPSEAVLHRQMVAYFLRRPVIADWSDAEYISNLGSMPAEPVLAARSWRLVYAPSATSGRVANLRLEPPSASPLLARNAFGPGWYGPEKTGNDSWRWLEERGAVEFMLNEAGHVVLGADVAIVGANRTLTIAIKERPDLDHRYSLTERWFTPFVSDSVQLAAGRYHVTISADGPGRPLGAADPRIVRAGVRNLAWIALSDSLVTALVPGE